MGKTKTPPKSFSEMITDAQRMAEPTETEYALIDKLKAEGGFSTAPIYQALCKKLLAWTFLLDDKVYYILKDGSYPLFSVQIRIPTLHHTMEDNIKERNRLESYKKMLSRFITKYSLDQTKIEDCRYLLAIFMVFPFAISVPAFLKDELVGSIQRADSEFNEISPNFIVVSCPVCDKNFKVDYQGDMVTCPHCDSGFTI